MKQIKIPKLKENEIYAGAVINPDGTGHHIILLDADSYYATWQLQMNWAKKQGGDLPNRVESALLFNKLKDRFKPEWYWTNDQHDSYFDYAWYCNFGNGVQNYHFNSDVMRAKAIFRLDI